MPPSYDVVNSGRRFASPFVLYNEKGIAPFVSGNSGLYPSDVAYGGASLPIFATEKRNFPYDHHSGNLKFSEKTQLALTDG